jgi:hypothetical protein
LFLHLFEHGRGWQLLGQGAGQVIAFFDAHSTLRESGADVLSNIYKSLKNNRRLAKGGSKMSQKSVTEEIKRYQAVFSEIASLAMRRRRSRPDPTPTWERPH